MKNRKILIYSILLLALIVAFGCNPKTGSKPESNASSVWSIEKAQEWGKKQPWYRGSNFNPSSAINQLETWQAESFDPATIDRELGWAQSIGFNCMRIYLHHLAWEIDQEGFKSRMDQYMNIADKHGIKTIFVFFDDCWNPVYHAGKQPDPKPGVHNSGWVRDPGTALFDSTGNVNNELIVTLESYVKDVLTTFSNDKRILLWDLYNEPGNNRLGNKSMMLLEKVFEWGREVNPSQPLSAGLWNNDLKDLNKFQVGHSDVITYHNYKDEVDHQHAIDTLKQYNRPLICTEYMARRNNSRFQNIMPLLKENNIGAINWGLVSGKSNTIFAWDTPIPDGKEPALWFHDIFRTDGSVFDQKEIDLIKLLTNTN
jgi:hypothetical protein